MHLCITSYHDLSFAMLFWKYYYKTKQSNSKTHNYVTVIYQLLSILQKSYVLGILNEENSGRLGVLNDTDSGKFPGSPSSLSSGLSR